MCIVQRFIFGQVFTLFMTFKAKSGYMFQVNMNEKTGRIRITTFFSVRKSTRILLPPGGMADSNRLNPYAISRDGERF